MKIYNVSPFQQSANNFKARLLVEQTPYMQRTFKKTPKKEESFNKIMKTLSEAVEPDTSIDTIEIKGKLTGKGFYDIAPNSTPDNAMGTSWSKGPNMRTATNLQLHDGRMFHAPNYRPIRPVAENIEIVVTDNQGNKGTCGFFLAQKRRGADSWVKDFLKSIEHAKNQIGASQECDAGLDELV